jgi:signal transduction histidine kinase
MAKATADKWMLLRRPGAAGQALAVKAKGLNDGRTLLTLAEFPGDQPTSTPAPADVNQKVDPLASSEALGELGHEMRTPLNAVIGFTDVLLARSFGPLNDRQSQYLQDIGGAGRHMLEMVDNMLDHAKMVSGRFPFEAEWTSIPELIGEATRLLEPTAKLDGVRLIQHPSKPIEAFVDRRALLQALLNLLANAIKFTPEGGKVTLSAILDDEMFALMVADTGEGIPDSDLKLVTQPFTQARRLGGRPLKGAGLGLSIVSAVAKLHGGQIDISSTLGAGTIINIKMPADRARLLEEA